MRDALSVIVRSTDVASNAIRLGSAIIVSGGDVSVTLNQPSPGEYAFAYEITPSTVDVPWTGLSLTGTFSSVTSSAVYTAVSVAIPGTGAQWQRVSMLPFTDASVASSTWVHGRRRVVSTSAPAPSSEIACWDVDTTTAPLTAMEGDDGTSAVNVSRSLEEAFTARTNLHVRHVVSGDLVNNGDDVDDVLAVTGSGVLLLRGSAEGAGYVDETLLRGLTVASSNVMMASIADVDGDGDVDVLVSGVMVYCATASGLPTTLDSSCLPITRSWLCVILC